VKTRRTLLDDKQFFCCDAHGFSFFYFFALSFLSRVSILTRDIDIANNVRLSVRLSVRNVPVLDEKG